jgi:RNA polymerase sigma-70 factor (ECF subfamily)
MTNDFNFKRDHVESKLKELFILAMNGDQQAYESFLSLSSALVKRYLFFIGGINLAQENADDLHQEILMSIHLKKHTYRTDKAILPWIYAVTKYKYIDYYRHKKRQPLMIEFDELTKYTKEEKEMELSFDDILEFLTPKQISMLTLVKVEGLSYKEAAASINMSVPSLKTSIHRLVKTIQKKVGK